MTSWWENHFEGDLLVVSVEVRVEVVELVRKGNELGGGNVLDDL